MPSATPPTIAVLAGGRATRLGELAKATPKALIEIAGKPFLRWQLELLAAHGLQDVVLCIGHYADQIEAWVADHPVPGLRVQFSRDGATPLGTGGALLRALPLLSSPFMVMYGDSYLRCDYLDIFRGFVTAAGATGNRPEPLGLMTVFENQGRYDTSNVVYRGGRILLYDKSAPNPDMHHIDYGLGILTHAAFDDFARDESFDLAQVYHALLSAGRLTGHEVRERFYEVGSHAGIEEFRSFLEASMPTGS